MQPGRILLVGLLVLGAAHAAAAQQTRVDVSRLGIDLAKIQIELRQAAAAQSENHGLRIRYTIDVYGQAPRIEFFTRDDNLQTGPVPYGAPTHREMINQVTPIEFRAPIMDFSALLRWLTDKGNKK
jgi:hypothetical protein